MKAGTDPRLTRHAPFAGGLKLLLVALLLNLGGCASTPAPEAVTTAEPEQSLAPTQRETLLQQLYTQHREWRNTPYQIGGQSREGIDCSGFVQLTYRSRLGLELPRTTGRLALSGTPVPAQRLAAGDLVFFLIDGDTRHVGIYLDKRRFLHASKSRGVIISHLDNPYWQAVYWRARRVL